MVSAHGPKTGSVFLASLECLPGNQPVHRAQYEVLIETGCILTRSNSETYYVRRERVAWPERRCGRSMIEVQGPSS